MFRAAAVGEVVQGRVVVAVAGRREVQRLAEAVAFQFQFIGALEHEHRRHLGVEVRRLALDKDALALLEGDFKIAVIARTGLAVDGGADKIRINPGNIGKRDRVEAVLTKVKNAGLPIRIGVNAGSLESNLLEKYGYPTPTAMVESAETHIKICREFDFEDIIVSLKASDARLMIDSYKLFSKKYDYPVHLGVTEAGPVKSGSIKSAIGLGVLLQLGIGDTIRVSLTDDPVEEVKVGFEILKSLGLASRGVTIISCPTCGRLEVDLFKIAGNMEEKLSRVKKPMSLALMGCAVNGPGEATHADMGIAFGKGGGLLYKDGEKIGHVDEDEAIERLLDIIENE